ncbi:type VI secretion system lipoprotein TssJ [Cupriavidus malaysiensis]|uniref:Type VI secretion system-associated lipoprotein n=1 Tax=Cupriavidus malaysiensis TaxID=367825 RepID=A0ABN4TQL7_9BURK|nr:type VI secretion system-associated lipoprotein [Cupriavidus malaysiensis]
MRYSRFRVDDLDGLKADLLATRDVVLRPDAAASISEPMKDDAQYVGVVALFRDSGKSGVWKLLIPRKQWKSTDPVKIVANDNVLELVGTQPEPVKPQAPQQSAPNAQKGAPAADGAKG